MVVKKGFIRSTGGSGHPPSEQNRAVPQTRFYDPSRLKRSFLSQNRIQNRILDLDLDLDLDLGLGLDQDDENQ